MDVSIPVLRAAYRKTGILRMVAHRDFQTQLKRAFLRARLPLRYSEGFSPKPRFRLAPPLPLGAEAGEDWIDLELTEDLSPEDFLARLGPQSLAGLVFTRAYLVDRQSIKLDALLAYADQPPDRLLRNMLWDVRRFTGLAEQSDDITMVGLRVGDV